MQAFLHLGHSVVLPAPYEVHGGDGLMMGALFGVAKTWSSPGQEVEIETTGVFDLKKAAGEEWQIGDRLYWDDQARALTKFPANNQLIGVAIEATKDRNATIGRVKVAGIVA